MKQVIQKLVLLFLLAVTFYNASSQSKSDPFAAATPLLYLGIDFTEVRVINEPEEMPLHIKKRYFVDINQVILNEPKKYDWQKALDKTNFSSDLSLVTARNEKTDETKILSTNTADENRLKPADIEKMVKQYDFTGKKGVGLIVFMESLSKTSENGSMWVTFVDMDTQTLVLTERMAGKAKGFGFRNYYAYTVYKVIEDIKKNKLSAWRSK
ncbi:hypothetical protein [Flavihumibacter fluvii]|uniref:hypothetical protein n=1 Tax=Flavihumibacter fluvii TaxID=2838157 RepID=UPI001BDF143E|nr:hypothetical protein [Flavihumibacter fluvii]ULQ51478.1 hypothetical protein KJS93_15425 [Flavihumibacter fluvii]